MIRSLAVKFQIRIHIIIDGFSHAHVSLLFLFLFFSLSLSFSSSPSLPISLQSNDSQRNVHIIVVVAFSRYSLKPIEKQRNGYLFWIFLHSPNSQIWCGCCMQNVIRKQSDKWVTCCELWRGESRVFIIIFFWDTRMHPCCIKNNWFACGSQLIVAC